MNGKCFARYGIGIIFKRFAHVLLSLLFVFTAAFARTYLGADVSDALNGKVGIFAELAPCVFKKIFEIHISVSFLQKFSLKY